MAAAAAAVVGVEDFGVGFEEAMSCLPSHVVDEAISWNKNNYRKDDVKFHFNGRHRSKLPTDHQAFQPHSKSSSRVRHPKPRNWGNWASGEPGMQAFFLDSGQKSCGTGVFLPQSVGTTSQSSRRRPACSPVLLPSRVIQALNLNVHELGLQISPKKDAKNNATRKGGDLKKNSTLNANKNGKDNVSTRCVISQNENASPEIYLPKEWTY